MQVSIILPPTLRFDATEAPFGDVCVLLSACPARNSQCGGCHSAPVPCSHHLPSTTTTVSVCDSLCEGLDDGGFVSEDCCSDSYCFCSEINGNPSFNCPAGMGFCPNQLACVEECSETECCIPTTPPPPPTTTTQFESYCDKICFGAENGFYGDCCQELYCDCESYGWFEMSCSNEEGLWCPRLNSCIPNCPTDCGC